MATTTRISAVFSAGGIRWYGADMSFAAPAAPAAPPPPPPPPAPPILAGGSVQDTGAAARAAAAAAAGGMGFAGTVASSPQGAAKPAVANKTLLGQ
jgi:hypothetical protein